MRSTDFHRIAHTPDSRTSLLLFYGFWSHIYFLGLGKVFTNLAESIAALDIPDTSSQNLWIRPVVTLVGSCWNSGITVLTYLWLCMLIVDACVVYTRIVRWLIVFCGIELYCIVLYCTDIVIWRNGGSGQPLYGISSWNISQDLLLPPSSKAFLLIILIFLLVILHWC